MKPQSKARFQRRLLAWYSKNARDLPWRRTSDPYAIWVSEIMLQQTQVDTVIPYYQRWLKRFPTVRALARAPLSAVLKLWAGLGYYRRARMLHEAAKTVAAEHAGKLPPKAAELVRLPGIGRYTAGAIASIAFGESTPVLDGNVIRVLSRLLALEADVKLPRTVSFLWGAAAALVPEKTPGDFNQAMMELGATVCFPRQPACAKCPVAALCGARKIGRVEYFPVTGKREKIEKIKTAALVLRNNGKVLVQKQPDAGRWGGLWMFPFWDSAEALKKAVGKTGLTHRLRLFHGFTRYQVQLDVYEGAGPAPELAGARWLDTSRVRALPLPAAHKKIAEQLLNP